jgi:CRISPR/Cas system-associated exonuclease Cas4 (RecB family)
MTDERKSKMSGSGMKGYADCAGKFQLEQTCPADNGNIYSQMGDRIHDYMAVTSQAHATAVLAEDEQHIANRCWEEYAKITEALGLGEPEFVTTEKRLWYGDIWSGQIDRIDHHGDTALVVDWKTGRNPQGNAAENLQLRAYAVLVKKNLPNLKRIFVAIVQPMAAPFTIAEYEESDLKLADEQIQGIVAAALAPNAPRTPSPDACKYCRAKSICPEAQGQATALAEVKSEVIPTLTNEQVADFLEKATIVEAFIESLRAEAKQRLKDGVEIAGYKLTAGRTSRSIESLQEAHSRLSGIIGEEAFLSACKVSVPTLEKAFASAKGLKGKSAKEEFEKEVHDLLINKQGEPVMTRTK